MVALVNISSEKWPPRHRTYFGSLAISSPQPGEAFAITPIRGCLGVMDLGDKRTMEFRITPRQPRIGRSEEHTSELQSHSDLVCRLLLEKKKKKKSIRP